MEIWVGTKILDFCSVFNAPTLFRTLQKMSSNTLSTMIHGQVSIIITLIQRDCSPICNPGTHWPALGFEPWQPLPVPSFVRERSVVYFISAGNKPGKLVLYMCVRGSDFACFYNFSIRFWTWSADVVVLFFIFILLYIIYHSFLSLSKLYLI